MLVTESRGRIYECPECKRIMWEKAHSAAAKSLAIFQMKPVKNAVDNGSEQDADGNQQRQAAVERVEAGEQLAAPSLQRRERSHPREYHRCIREGVDPLQLLEIVVAGHASQQG